MIPYQFLAQANGYVSHLVTIRLNEFLHDTGEVIILCFLYHYQELLDGVNSRGKKMESLITSRTRDMADKVMEKENLCTLMMGLT